MLGKIGEGVGTTVSASGDCKKKGKRTQEREGTDHQNKFIRRLHHEELRKIVLKEEKT